MSGISILNSFGKVELQKPLFICRAGEQSPIKEGSTEISKDSVDAIFSRFSIPQDVKKYSQRVDGQIFAGSDQLLIIVPSKHISYYSVSAPLPEMREAQSIQKNVYLILKALFDSNIRLQLMEGTWIGVEMLQYCPPMERLEWEEQNYMLSELFAFNEAEQSFRCYYAGEVQSIGVETKDLYIRRAALVNAIKQKRGQPIIHRAVEWLTNTGELENYQKEMDSILAEGKSLSELKKEMSDIDDERSRAFVANSLNAMQNSKKNIGFVVVGSRHEEIMRKELESRKVSYLVLAQSKIDKEDKVSKGK